MPMSSRYNTRLFQVFTSLEKDLASKKITQEEFDILLGLYIEKEFSDTIISEIDELLPDSSNDLQGANLLTYQWKRTFKHA
jgi:hypothetical protein